MTLAGKTLTEGPEKVVVKRPTDERADLQALEDGKKGRRPADLKGPVATFKYLSNILYGNELWVRIMC
jgi:hypothetical protein